MAVYPVNLNIKGRPCAVIGGGRVAARKVRSLLKAGADVTVISPQLVQSLRALVNAGIVNQRARGYCRGDIRGFFLVICATDEVAVNQAAALEAREAGVLVNIVDDSELADFTVPATVERGDLVFTVSTGGNSPALARRLREELADCYGEEYGLYLDMLGRIRRDIPAIMDEPAERGKFWRRVLDREVLALLRAGRLREAEEKLRREVAALWGVPGARPSCEMWRK